MRLHSPPASDPGATSMNSEYVDASVVPAATQAPWGSVDIVLDGGEVERGDSNVRSSLCFAPSLYKRKCSEEGVGTYDKQEIRPSKARYCTTVGRHLSWELKLL